MAESYPPGSPEHKFADETDALLTDDDIPPLDLPTLAKRAPRRPLVFGAALAFVVLALSTLR